MLLANGSALTDDIIDLQEDINRTETDFLVALDAFSRTVERGDQDHRLAEFLAARKRLRDVFFAREQQLLSQGSMLREAYRQQHHLVLRTLDHLQLNLELGIPESDQCSLSYLRSL